MCAGDTGEAGVAGLRRRPRNCVDTSGQFSEDDRVSFEGLAPVTDVRAGAWIAPRLCGFGGRVCCVVPAGFAGYARVLHPAADERGRLASWAQVCELTGRIAHPLMQWHTISTAPPTDSPAGAVSWPGSDPEVGNLCHPPCSPVCLKYSQASLPIRATATTRCGRAGDGGTETARSGHFSL